MLASIFGEMEPKRIKARVAAAHKRLRKTDRWAGGKPPCGYRIVDRPGGGRTLEPDPVASEAFRYMGKLFLEGQSQWMIATVLEAAGFGTPATHVFKNQGESTEEEWAAVRAAMDEPVQKVPLDVRLVAGVGVQREIPGVRGRRPRCFLVLRCRPGSTGCQQPAGRTTGGRGRSGRRPGDRRSRSCESGRLDRTGSRGGETARRYSCAWQARIRALPE